jgi:hypothetical protein
MPFIWLLFQFWLTQLCPYFINVCAAVQESVLFSVVTFQMEDRKYIMGPLWVLKEVEASWHDPVLYVPRICSAVLWLTPASSAACCTICPCLHMQQRLNKVHTPILDVRLSCCLHILCPLPAEILTLTVHSSNIQTSNILYFLWTCQDSYSSLSESIALTS